ncbi:MAG: DNA polymerase III subunit epsilon [Chromatiales bacterium]|nr:DNA polymerase III subunit epsilon [Chromatiales bacterium]
MRQVVLDTETTGLEPESGHRVIEIGAVELVDRRYSGRQFHQYIDPKRAIDAGALEVHGISSDFLRGKPRFAEIATEFIEFIDGAELVIHNAPFDVAFLDAEFSRLGGSVGKVHDRCEVLDSLALARQKHPGQRNSLDALCKRYEVDNSQRDLHGALLDAEILADVYLAMTGGQTSLELVDEVESEYESRAALPRVARAHGVLRVVRADAGELASHQARLEAIRKASGECVWSDVMPDECA